MSMSGAVRDGYKRTEVGVIPEDWAIASAAEICELVVDCKNRTPRVVDSSEFAVVRTPNVRNGEFVREELRFTDEMSFREWTARAVPQVGDILITREAPLGEVCPVPADLRVCLGQRMMLYRPAPTKASSKYLLYALMSAAVQSNLLRKIGGSTVGHAKVDDIRNLQIPVPANTDEQRAIAVALSDVDVLLAKLDGLITKKRDLKQAAVQQLLAGQTRLPGFSGEWTVQRLGDVAGFHKGKGLPKSAINPFGAELCIHYGELFTRYPETIGTIISRTTGWRDSFRSISNDVLMPTSDVTPRGLAKASCITVDDVILGGDILIIRPEKQLLDGSFLSYVIRREEDQVLQLVSGSTVFHLYGSDMKRFFFSMPPLAEQTAITTVLAAMDAELTSLESRRDKTRALKQGMMQELLTGRIRLI
jgi:type I restriction enzyme S subunit